MARLLTRVATLAGILAVATLPARAAEPFNIDVMLPLTGNAAFLGVAQKAAMQYMEKALGEAGTVGGRPIHFVFRDDQSSPQVAVQVATEIAASKPAVIIGPSLVAMCNAVVPLVRRGPVLYCLSPGIYPAPGSFVFSSSASTRELAKAQLRFFHAKHLDRLAIITSTDASGQEAQRNLREFIQLPEFKGMDYVGDATFNPTDVSAAAQIQRIKGADPQAIIAWSTGAAIGTVFKAIQDAGLNVPVATTNGNMTYAAMQRFADILPAELYIPTAEWLRSPRAEPGSGVAKAKDQFFGAYPAGTRPDGSAAFGWEPALIVVAALHKLGPDTTAEQLRDYIAGLTSFPGASGDYDFVKSPQRGLDDSEVVITRWDKAANDWVTVSQPRGVPL